MENWSLWKYHSSVPFGERGLPHPFCVRKKEVGHWLLCWPHTWLLMWAQKSNCVCFEEVSLTMIWVKRKWACSLMKLALVSCCLCCWRAAWHISPLATACCGGQMSNQSWCKGERLQESRENQGLHFQYLFDQFACNTKLHFKLISLSSRTSARPLYEYVMFHIWRASYFMCPITQKYIAVWLGGRNQLFQWAQCVASVMAQKKDQWIRSCFEKTSSTKYRKIGLKIHCQMYCPVLQRAFSVIGKEMLAMNLHYLLCTKGHFTFKERTDSDAGPPQLIFRPAGTCLHLCLCPGLMLGQTSGMFRGKEWEMTWEIAGCGR